MQNQLFVKLAISIGFLILNCFLIQAQESTGIFENGSDKLIVYTDLPGLAPSEFYKIRVRSNASRNEWVESFALVTRSLVEQAQVESGSDENYFSHLKDWSHTYNNIEMNSSVEVEISKADGSPITKAAIHPVAKGRDLKIGPDGKVTFFIDKPAQVTIDIDGKMDDQNTGYSTLDGYVNNRYDGPPIHTISIFANPIIEKPDTLQDGVYVLHPGETPPANPGSFNTLYFAAGVHDLGYDFKIFQNKKYYIPGDAIVYGTFNNENGEPGENIKIWGYGTISGDKIKHPEYDPTFAFDDATPGNAKKWKPISIEQAENVLVEGICIANPAFHSMALPPATNNEKVTFVRWVKVISWRGNGDGIGNAHVIEDSFLRTQDDATYVKGDRIRCVFWNDANGASMVMQGIADKFPILVADCDVIYARAQWHRWNGGRVFSARPINSKGQKNVNVLFRDIRIEDPRPTLQIFNLHSKDDLPPEFNSPSADIGESYSGITFQNITVAASSILGFPEILHGCEESPYSNLTFENVVIEGKLFTNINDFSFVNEWVTDIRFNPDVSNDASLFDIYINGVSLPEFKPDKENYNIALPAGTLEVPEITATQFDYDASYSILAGESILDTTKIIVVAEDGITTKTYTLNYTMGTTELINVVAPTEVVPGDTVFYTVTYSANEPCDLEVNIKSMSNGTGYAYLKIPVTTGTNTIEVKLFVRNDIPLAENAYRSVVTLIPAGRPWSEHFDVLRFDNIDAVAVPTNISASFKKVSDIKIYPNPVSNILYFSFSEVNKNRRVQIFNTPGQLMFEEPAIEMIKSVEIERLNSKGLVIARIITGSEFYSFKVLIEELNRIE